MFLSRRWRVEIVPALPPPRKVSLCCNAACSRALGISAPAAPCSPWLRCTLQWTCPAFRTGTRWTRPVRPVRFPAGTMVWVTCPAGQVQLPAQDRDKVILGKVLSVGPSRQTGRPASAKACWYRRRHKRIAHASAGLASPQVVRSVAWQYAPPARCPPQSSRLAVEACCLWPWRISGSCTGIMRSRLTPSLRPLRHQSVQSCNCPTVPPPPQSGARPRCRDNSNSRSSSWPDLSDQWPTHPSRCPGPGPAHSLTGQLPSAAGVRPARMLVVSSANPAPFLPGQPQALPHLAVPL